MLLRKTQHAMERAGLVIAQFVGSLDHLVRGTQRQRIESTSRTAEGRQFNERGMSDQHRVFPRIQRQPIFHGHRQRLVAQISESELHLLPAVAGPAGRHQALGNCRRQLNPGALLGFAL